MQIDVAIICTEFNRMHAWKTHVLKTIGNSIIQGGTRVLDRDDDVMYHFFYDKDPNKLRGLNFTFAVYDTEGSSMINADVESQINMAINRSGGKRWILT